MDLILYNPQITALTNPLTPRDNRKLEVGADMKLQSFCNLSALLYCQNIAKTCPDSRSIYMLHMRPI